MTECDSVMWQEVTVQYVGIRLEMLRHGATAGSCDSVMRAECSDVSLCDSVAVACSYATAGPDVTAEPVSEPHCHPVGSTAE